MIYIHILYAYIAEYACMVTISICAYLSVFCHHQSWHGFSSFYFFHHVISIHSCHPRVIQQRNTILFCFGCRIEWKSKFAKRQYNNQTKSKPKKICIYVPNCGMSQSAQNSKIWLFKFSVMFLTCILWSFIMFFL